MKTFCCLLFSLMVFSASAQPFAKGTKVDVYATDGKYYGATVIEAEGDQYKIRYLGYGADKDVWVKENALVRGGRKGDRVVVTSSSGVFNGVIEEVTLDQYKIKYDGYPDTYTLTRTQFHLVDKPVVIEGAGKTVSPVPAVSANAAAKTANTVAEQPVNAMATGFVIGGKIQALEGSAWYAATIKEIKNGKYLIKYDDYSQEDWLPAEKIRMKAMLPADKLKPTGGKIYLRSIRWIATGYTELGWYFLGDNGVIVTNPIYGLNPVNLALEQVNNWKNVGTYSISNGNININWLNGNKTKLALQYENGEITEMDAGGIMVRQKGLPDNYRISGTYSGSISFGDVGSSGTYIFGKDGSITVKTMGTVNTGVTAGLSENEKKGSYTIKGSTLMITYDNGVKETANIGLIGSNLVINSKWMTAK